MTTNAKPFTVTILKCDEPNANGRIYPREVVEKMVEQCEANQNRIFGTVGMPEGTSLDISKISHTVNNLRITEGGDLIGDVMVLSTPQGKVMQELLEVGKYDYRTAGIGKIDENGVVSDYRLISISMVSDGA
jgi:hypothetical protein